MALFDKLRTDISGLLSGGVGGPSAGGERAMHHAGQRIFKRWGDLAEQELRSTRQAYKEGMRIDISENSISLRLEGQLANMIEDGASPWDLRTTLLKQAGSPWPKRSKAGNLYRPIFFKISTKQIAGWGGSSVYRKQAVRLSPSIRTGASRRWGQKLPAGLAPNLRPKDISPERRAHATDPLHGLYRMKQKIGSVSHYGTFRTISWGVKPWTHPGFPGKHLMRKASKGIAGVIINSKGGQ